MIFFVSQVDGPITEGRGKGGGLISARLGQLVREETHGPHTSKPFCLHCPSYVCAFYPCCAFLE